MDFNLLYMYQDLICYSIPMYNISGLIGDFSLMFLHIGFSVIFIIYPYDFI